ECLKGNSCSWQIDPLKEYVLEKKEKKDANYFVRCKRCILAQIELQAKKSSQENQENNRTKRLRKSQNQHRLSSRQKELLAVRILSNRIEPEKLLLAENATVVAKLAFDIKCAPKAVFAYLNKQMKKLTMG